MATYVPAKKNTAYVTYVGLASHDDALVLQANPTLAAGDVKVAIDDGDPANITVLPVVDADFTKRVKVNLSAAEMNGDNISIIFSDAAGDEWCDLFINIQTAANQLDDIPSTTEFELRTLAAADYTIVTDLGVVQSADHTTAIADIPTNTEFGLRTLPSADYTIVSDLGTVQSGDSFAIVNGVHGLVSIQDDVDAILEDTGTTLENRLIAIEADTDVIDDGTSGLVKIASDVAAILVDTDTTIPGLITAASPSQHIPTANTENGNTTLDGGTFASVSTNDDATYYQTGPGVAVGGFGLNCVLTFGIGTGRVPSTLTVDGHFDSGAQRTVQVWAYDYILSAYVQLSNSATDFGNSASDRTQQYAMNPTMQNVTTGEVLVRFTSTSETITDVLEVDFCAVNSVAGAAAGLTADAIQAAVWSRGHHGHDEETLGYVVGHTFLLQGQIVSATNSQRFVIDAGVATDDAYNGMVITLEDKTDDHYESRVIQDYDGGTKEIYVDRIFSFTPVAGDDYYILNGTGANSAYIQTTLGNVNDVISNQVAITGAGFDTGTDSLAVLSDLINTIDGVVDTGLTLGQFMGLKK